MIAGITALALISYGTLVSRGDSDTAAFVDQQVQQGRRRLRDSVVFELLGMGTFDGLRQIYRECLEPNWDGYGALPVSEGAYWLAHQFLEALPLGTPPPSFGAEPDGQLTLEWHRSPRRTLSVSVSPEGELHYAALLGASKVYGTEPFFGEAPRAIMDLIHRVTAA